ncbi:hypothetical protein [Paenibacillus sp. UMB4589-SE434]|nr:hypothetical protein [Paenibacillus sp. UMB4589-SE434]
MTTVIIFIVNNMNGMKDFIETDGVQLLMIRLLRMLYIICAANS